ncbi:hypothetical protein CIPOMM221M3_04350 [Citrobacter portucalensis]
MKAVKTVIAVIVAVSSMSANGIAIDFDYCVKI